MASDCWGLPGRRAAGGGSGEAGEPPAARGEQRGEPFGADQMGCAHRDQRASGGGKLCLDQRQPALVAAHQQGRAQRRGGHDPAVRSGVERCGIARQPGAASRALSALAVTMVLSSRR